MTMQETEVRGLRAVAAPLAAYFRPFKRDTAHLAHLIAEGVPAGSGVVLDFDGSGENLVLREEARRAGLEVVIDSRAMELATEGGFARGPVHSLPWAGGSRHSPELLMGPEGKAFVEEFVRAAVEMRVNAVLAPTHFLEGEQSRWLAVDWALTQRLRIVLDEAGARSVAIYYPLATGLRSLTRPARQALIARLAQLPLDAIWLRVNNFGTSSSGPVSLRRYVEICRDFHELAIPIVGERTGTVGLPLLALGALGGIESGITLGERFAFSSLVRRSHGKPWIPAPRVYLGPIGALVKPTLAEPLLRRRGMHAYGCQGQECCPRGVTDMLRDSRRHFVVTRSRETQWLSQLPDSIRAEHYLDRWLRPASDRATRAMHAEPSLESHRTRLDRWRGTVSAIVEEDQTRTVSRSSVPDGTRVGTRRTT